MGGIQLVLDTVKAWSDVIYREFWITVERNSVEISALRASILTITKYGTYGKFWYDDAGWHEDTVQPGALLPGPTLRWEH